MTLTKKTNPLWNNELLQTWFVSDDIKHIKNKSPIVYYFKKYLSFRNFATVEKILQSGAKEIQHITEFQQKLNKESKKGTNGNVGASYIRRFLRFHNLSIPYPRTQRHTKKDYFDDDQIMKDWAEGFMNASSKESAIRTLYEFCLFMGKTPSKLASEVKSGITQKRKLKNQLLNFYEARKDVSKLTTEQKKRCSHWSNNKHSSSWFYVCKVKQFYREILDIDFTWKRNEIPNNTRGILESEEFEDEFENFKESVTKDEFMLMLEQANLTERTILHTLWSTGLSNIDITTLQYKSLKNFIDPFKPKELTEPFYIFWTKRSKTNDGFYAVISNTALELIQKMLRQKYFVNEEQKNVLGYKLDNSIKLTGESTIFANRFSQKLLSAQAIRKLTRRLSKLAELKREITPGVFRKTFYRKCREIAQMDKNIVELIMGHWRNGGNGDSSNMSDFHYGDRKKFLLTLKERITEEFQKCVDQRLFDIKKEDIKYKFLESSYQELVKERYNLKEEVEELKQVLTDFMSEQPEKMVQAFKQIKNITEKQTMKELSEPK